MWLEETRPRSLLRDVARTRAPPRREGEVRAIELHDVPHGERDGEVLDRELPARRALGHVDGGELQAAEVTEGFVEDEQALARRHVPQRDNARLRRGRDDGTPLCFSLASLMFSVMRFTIIAGILGKSSCKKMKECTESRLCLLGLTSVKD